MRRPFAFRALTLGIAGFASLFSVRPARAQSILPPVFGNWTISQATSVEPVTLDLAAGTDAAVVKEYGFQAIERQQYARGKDGLTVTLYRMTDPTAAYGAFTYLRPAGMQTSKLARFAAASPNRALIVVGNLLLDVSGMNLARSASELETLVASLTTKADRRPYPNIPEHLPEAGLVPGSERYLLGPVALQKLVPAGDGDWVGFSQGAEAIMARYHKGGREFTLFIAEYPTQQIAAKRFDGMTTMINANEAPTGSYPVAAADRKGELIAIAFGHRGDEVPARALIGQIPRGQDFIWDEPAFKAKELSWPTYIVGAFLGTGAIVLIAIISGLGFALIRVLVKIFFPGKVFDRHRRIEVLQLGLSGRPVDTKDFY